VRLHRVRHTLGRATGARGAGTTGRAASRGGERRRRADGGERDWRRRAASQGKPRTQVHAELGRAADARGAGHF
jgi:hypothetical protein